MLLNLINDLLDLAKQDKFTFDLNKNYFNLVDTVNSTFKTLEYLSISSKISLHIGMRKRDKKFFENLYGDKNRYE